MIDWRTSLAAASGVAPAGELVQARRGLTRTQIRAARRAVRKGTRADDPAVARLAVAHAHQIIRRQPSSWTPILAVIIFLLMLDFSIHAVSHGGAEAVAGVAVAVCSVVGALNLAQTPSRQRNARQAEQLNRDVLDTWGEVYEEDAMPARVGPVALAVSSVMLWIFNDLLLGGLLLAFDGRTLSLARVVGQGAGFATITVILNLVWVRRRTERQARRPIE